MKNRVLALMVAGGLLLSASGPTLAAGKLGTAGGADEFRFSRPVYAGKLGGASGMDRSAYVTATGGEESGETESPERLGGKIEAGGGDD